MQGDDMINDIPKNWQNALTRYIGEDKWVRMINNMEDFLQDEDYHPQGKKIFAALKATPFNKVRVVIIGQEPYPCKRCATGIAFFAGGNSTKSLRNIYTAIENDLGGKPTDNCLKRWAKEEYVLLLNRSLTFHRDVAKNNQARTKWLFFTKAVVKALSDSGRPIHFMLWGSKVHTIKWSITEPSCRRQACHPVPRVGIDRDFRNCTHFSEVDTILRIRGEAPINWLP